MENNIEYLSDYLPTSSVSDRLNSYLQRIALELNLDFRVVGKNTPVEVFVLGQEEARLIKKIDAPLIGGAINKVIFCAECWEYKKFPWWQEALLAMRTDIFLLDTPLSKIAFDAGVNDYQSLFIPNEIIKFFGYEADKAEKRSGIEDFIFESIGAVLNPKIQPHFIVQDCDNMLRLIPQTAEAAQTRFENNALYLNLLTVIKDSVPLILEKFNDFFYHKTTK
jgi:hypothetical protein